MKRIIYPFYFSVFLFVIVSCTYSNFVEKQKRNPRVREAIKQKDLYLKKLFSQKRILYPPQKIYIRIFKLEAILELWVFSPPDEKFKLVKTYKICSTSGLPGPKRREGDRQIPEGIYYIDRFNPRSNYYLSLGLNYPNWSDRIRGNKKNPGGDIFIHGACVTIGCIPITNDKIKELYWIAVQARGEGQKAIPVHIFPCRMMGVSMVFLKMLSYNPFFWSQYKLLIKNAHPRSPEELISFWYELKNIYDYFEKYRRIPPIIITPKGKYIIRQ